MPSKSTPKEVAARPNLKIQDLMGLAARQSGVTGGYRVPSAVRRAELAIARRAEGVAIIAEGFRP